MGFTKHKNKIVNEKISVVKSIHNSKDSLKKVWKLQIKFSEFDRFTGYSVLFLCSLTLILFLCYLHSFVCLVKLISILCFETNFIFVVCSYVIYEITNVYQEKILKAIIKTKVLKSQP